MADLFEEDSFFHIRMESDEESDLSGDEHKFDPTGADAAAMTYLSPEARAEYLVGCGAEDFENDIDKARRLSKQTLEEEKFKRMEDRAIRKSIRAEKRRLRAEKESGYIQRQPVDQSRREEEDLFRSIVDRQKQHRGTHISPVNHQQSHRPQPHVHNYESNVSHHRPSPSGEQHQLIGTLTMDALAIHNVIHESKKYHNFSEHIIETLDKDPELEAALRISEIEAAKHNSQQTSSNGTSGRGNMGRAHTHTFNNAGSGPGVGAPVRISPRANSYKPSPTQDTSMQRSLYESELEEALRRSQEEAEAAAAVAAITALEEQQEVQQVRNGTSVPHSNQMQQPAYRRKPSAKMSSSEPPVRLNSFNSRENVSPARNLGVGPSGGEVHFHHQGSFDDELEQALRLSLMEQEQSGHYPHQHHHNQHNNNNSSNINGGGTSSGGHNSAQHSHFTSPTRLLSPFDVQQQQQQQQQQQRMVSPANRMVSPSMQGIAAGRHNNLSHIHNNNNSNTYTTEQLRLQALEAAQVSVLLAKTKSESVREHREHKSSSPSLLNQMSFNSSTGKLTHQSTSSSGKLTHQSSIGSSGVGAGERYISPGNLPVVSDDPGLQDPAVQRFMEARALKKQASKNEALRKEIINEVHHLDDNDIIENVDISVPLMPALVHGAVSEKGRNPLGSAVPSHSRANSLSAVNQPGSQLSSQPSSQLGGQQQTSFTRPVLVTQGSLALSSDGDYSPLLSPMGVNFPVNNNLYSPSRGIHADYTQQQQHQQHGTPQHIAAQPPSVHVFSAEVGAEYTHKAQQVRGLTRGPALIEIPLTPGRQPPVSRQNSDENPSQPSPSGHGRNPSHSSIDGHNYQSQAHGHLGPLQLMSSHPSAQHSTVHSAVHSAYGSAQPSAQHSAQHSRQSSNEFQRQLSNESTSSAVMPDSAANLTAATVAATTVSGENNNAGSAGRPVRPSSAGNFIQRSKPSTKQLSDSPVTTPASGADHDISPRTPGTGTPQHTMSGTGTPQHTASPHTPHTQTKRPSGVFIQRSRRPSALSEDVQTTETDTKNALMNTHNTLQTQLSAQNVAPSTPQTAPLTTSKSRRSSQSDPNHSAANDSVNNTPTTAGFGVAAYEEEPMYSIDELPQQQPVQQPMQQTVTYEQQMELIARRSRSNSRVEPLPLNPVVQQQSRSRANSRVFLDSQQNIQQQQQEQQMQYNQYLMQNQQQNQQLYQNQQLNQYSGGNISRQHSGEQYSSYSGGSPKSVSPRSPLPYDQQQQPSRLVFQNLSRSRDDDNDSRSEMSGGDSKCDSKSVHSGSSSNTPRSTGSVRKQLQPARIQQQQQQQQMRGAENGPTSGMRPEAAATYFQHPHNNSEPSSRLNTNTSAALTTDTTETFENYDLQPLGQLQNPPQNPPQNNQHQGGQGGAGSVVDHTALQQEEKLASAITLLTQAMQTMTPTTQQLQQNNNSNSNTNNNNNSHNPGSAMEAAVHLLKEAMTTPATAANEEPHDPHSAALAAARVLLANLNISTTAAPRSNNSQQQYQQVGTSPAGQPTHYYQNHPSSAESDRGGHHFGHPRSAETDSPGFLTGQQPGYNVPLSTFSTDSYGASNSNTPHHQGFSEDPSPYRGIATEISSSNRFSGNNTPLHIATASGKTPRNISRLSSAQHNDSPHLPLPPATRAGTTTAPYYLEGQLQHVEPQNRIRTASRDYREMPGREMSGRDSFGREMSGDDRDTSRDSLGQRDSLGPRDRDSLGQHPGYSHTDTSGRLTSATSERSSLQPSPQMFHGNSYNTSNVGSRDFYDPHLPGLHNGGGQGGPGDLYAVSPPPQVHVFQHNSMPQLGHMRPISIDTHDPRTNHNNHQQQQQQQSQQQYTQVHHNTPHNTPHYHNQQQMQQQQQLQQGPPQPYYAQQSPAYGAPSPQHHGQWVPDPQQYQQSVPHHQPQGLTPHARSNTRLAENNRPDLSQSQHSYDPARQYDPRADFQHSKSYSESPSHQMYGQPEVPYYADPIQQQQQQQTMYAHRTPRTSFRQGTTLSRPSQQPSHDTNGAGAPLPNARSGRMISPVVIGPAMTSGGVSVASKDSIGGNWECSICTLMNEATFLTCDACGSTKNPKI